MTDNGVWNNPINMFTDIPWSWFKAITYTFTSSHNNQLLYIKLPCPSKSIICNWQRAWLSNWYWNNNTQYSQYWFLNTDLWFTYYSWYAPWKVCYFTDDNCLEIKWINSTHIEVLVKVSWRRPIQCMFLCFS